MRPTRATSLLALLATMLAGARTPARAADPYPGYESAIYGNPANWLCRPDTDDVCDHDLDATVVKANGKTRVAALARGAQAAHRLLLRLPDDLDSTRRATATSCPAPTRSSSSCASRRRVSARCAACSRRSTARSRSPRSSALLGGRSHPGRPRPRLRRRPRCVEALHRQRQRRSRRHPDRTLAGRRAPDAADQERDRPEPRAARPPGVGNAPRHQPAGAGRAGRGRRLPERSPVPEEPPDRLRDQLRIVPLDGSAAGEQLLRRVAPGRAGRLRAPTRPRSRAAAARCIPICPTTAARCRSSPPPPIQWVDPSLGVDHHHAVRHAAGLPRGQCAEHNGFSYLAITVDGEPVRSAHRRHRRRSHAGVGPPPGRRQRGDGRSGRASRAGRRRAWCSRHGCRAPR